MTSCLSDDDLAALASGALAGESLASAEAHLRACEKCGAVLAALLGDGVAGGEEPRRIGRYVAGAPLGAGAMGVVYRAHDPELNRDVALKLLVADKTDDADAVAARLLREAKAMAQVSHPNVVSVFDAGTFGDRVFLAMELVPGETLTAWTRSRTRTWREIARVFAQCARGLAAAHAAGLVHRDFKPDNVLVTPDGRAKVTDFGLARVVDVEAAAPASPTAPAPAPATPTAPAPATPTATPTATSLGASVTRAGALRGTPSYMAPEQLRGEPADARADQFGFGVALFEALTGERPFEGRTLPELRASVLAGRVRAAPALRRLPAGLRRAIARTLNTSPADRFASMDDVAGTLEHAVQKGPVLWMALGVACVAVAALAAGRATTARPSMCAGAAGNAGAVWDDATREKVRGRILATKTPFADDAWRSVDEALTAYARDYGQARVDACEATHVRGEQSGEMLDLRMACLDLRVTEGSALVRQLSAADAKTVAKAAQEAVALPPLAVCADRAFLRARVPPAADPSVRARAQKGAASLADAKAAMNFGDAARAGTLVAQVLEDARSIGYAPLEGEALAARGALEFDAGDAVAGERTLFSALYLAERAHDDELVARVWTSLADLTSTIHGLGRSDEGSRLLDLAAAAIDRAGNPWDQRLHLEETAGLVAKERGHYDEAIRHHQAALALATEKLGPEHYEVGSCNIYLAQDLRRSADFARAEEHHARGVRIVERTLGPNHPRMARAHHDMAVLYGHLRRFDDARAAFDRAARILAVTVPPNHRDVGHLEHSIGETLMLEGRARDAVPHLEKALRVGEESLPPDHPLRASMLAGLGRAYVDVGDTEKGRVALAKALEMYTHYEEEPPMRGDTEFAMARALDALHREPQKARDLARAARADYGVGNPLYAEERARVDAWLAAHGGAVATENHAP